MATERTLVLVLGSGRTGAGLLAGCLQRLGYTVPGPPMPSADEESKWVVDFHDRLLELANVQVADARPSAWAATADVALDNEAEESLRSWLARSKGDVVIKDPRLAWFLPLWRRAGEAVGTPPRFALTFRHPGAQVDGDWQGDAARIAGWLNTTLFTERATREGTRAWIGHDEIAEDWTVAIGRLGEELDLEPVRTAAPPAMRRVHDLLDGVPAGAAEWGDARVPAALRELADRVHAEVSGARDAAALDTARADYIALYEEAEAVAHSSIVGARRRGRGAKGTAVAGPATKAARLVPRGVRRKVPVRWRRRVLRTLGR